MAGSVWDVGQRGGAGSTPRGGYLSAGYEPVSIRMVGLALLEIGRLQAIRRQHGCDLSLVCMDRPD